MNKQTIHLAARLRLTTAVLLAVLLGGVLPGSVSKVNAQSQKQMAPSSGKGGPKEGIKVHGFWTIEVRSPDGKLVTRREFENGLTGAGSDFLVGFIGRSLVPGEWRVFLQGAFGTWAISEPTSIEPTAFPTLKVQLEGIPTQLVLRGNVTAPVAGTVTNVNTGLTVCGYVEASVCRSGPGHQSDPEVRFTEKTLGPSTNPPTAPVPVEKDQIVQVTVVISFS